MRKLLLAGAAVALATAFTTPAHAILQISAEVNGDTFFCADNTGCDLNATPNILTIGPTIIGGVTFSGSEQIQTIGPPTNTLLTNSLTIRNTTGSTADIQFAVGGTGFAAPTETFTASGSGTWLNAATSTISMDWYGDTTNQQGATTVNDLPGQLLTSAGPFVATGPADSFATGPLSGAFVTTAPFSWTMFAEGTLVSGATSTLAGRSQDITNTVAVPEPGTLAILGAALTGFGWYLRRRRNLDSDSPV